jgi:hypothetical protein
MSTSTRFGNGCADGGGIAGLSIHNGVIDILYGIIASNTWPFGRQS